MEALRQYGEQNVEVYCSSSGSESLDIELKRKIPGNKTVSYERDEYEKRYESSSDDLYTSSSTSSLSSSPEPVLQTKKQVNSGKQRETKTKGEMSLDDLPRIEDLKITVSQEELQLIGKISAIVDRLVVVLSEKNLPALDMDSVLFLGSEKPLGQVFDTFGPVQSPYYCVRFNSGEEIKDKGIEVGLDVYFVPNDECITNYVLYQELRREKGSDASWKNNNEPPVECVDFSDDEAERSARQIKKGKRVLPNNGGDPAYVLATTTVRNATIQENQYEACTMTAAPKVQSYLRHPSSFGPRQGGMSSYQVRSVRQPVSPAARMNNNKSVQSYVRNIRPQMSYPGMTSALQSAANNYAPNQVVNPYMTNVRSHSGSNVSSQQPHNIAVSPPVVGNLGYPQHQVRANISPSYNSGNGSLMLCSPAMSQPARPISYQQSQSVPWSGVVFPWQISKPVFSAPPMFNSVLLLPPPPPPQSFPQQMVNPPAPKPLIQEQPVSTATVGCQFPSNTPPYSVAPSYSQSVPIADNIPITNPLYTVASSSSYGQQMMIGNRFPTTSSSYNAAMPSFRQPAAVGAKILTNPSYTVASSYGQAVMMENERAMTTPSYSVASSYRQPALVGNKIPTSNASYSSASYGQPMMMGGKMPVTSPSYTMASSYGQNAMVDQLSFYIPMPPAASRPNVQQFPSLSSQVTRFPASVTPQRPSHYYHQ